MQGKKKKTKYLVIYDEHDNFSSILFLGICIVR